MLVKMSIYFNSILLLFYLLLSECYNYSFTTLRELCDVSYTNDTTFEEIIKNNFIENVCYIYRKSNTSYIDTIINDKTNSKCFNNIIKTLDDSSYYYSMLINSGSKLMKLGNEESCINFNLTYLLLNFQLDSSFIEKYRQQFIKNKQFNPQYQVDERYAEMAIFLSLSEIKLGLCLWEDCDEVFIAFFNQELNAPFYQFLSSTSFFNGITYIMNSRKTREEKKVNVFDVFSTKSDQHFTLAFVIFLAFSLFILLARIILAIIYKVISSDDTSADNVRKKTVFHKKKLQMKNNNSITELFPDFSKSTLINDNTESKINSDTKEEEEGEKKENKDNNGEEQEDEEEDDSLHSSNLFNDWGVEKNRTNISEMNHFLNKNETSTTEAVSHSNKSDSQKKEVNFLINSSSNDTIKKPPSKWKENFIEEYEKISMENLYTVASKLYNSKNIEIFSGLRTIFLVSMTIFRVFVYFYTVLWNSPGTYEFYGKFSITFIKLSMLSFHVWIFLDGLIYTYKILCLIETKEKGDFTWKDVVSILVNLLPKVIVFLIVYFSFFIGINNFAVMFGSTTLFKNFHIQYISHIKCFNNPGLVFALPYIGFTENINQNMSCFHFSYLTYNELICILLLLLIFYLLYKFRSKLVEGIIFSIVVIHFFISYVYYISLLSDKQILIFDYVLGEDASYQRAPLLFNAFLLGIFTGYIYYYSKLLNINKDHYYPFQFCSKIMRFFSRLKVILRHTISFFALLLWISIDTVYFFMKNYSSNSESFSLLFLFTPVLKVLFVYESQISTILFAIVVIDIFLSEEFWIKVILSNSIFIIFERCSFAFLILNECVTILFITLFDITGINWDYENILYLSVVIFVLNLFLAAFITGLFEIPLKYLMKKISIKLKSDINSNSSIKYK